ncbi:sorbose reductase [Niveispirillum sp. SYP-B3756]|uniref:chaperone NapD n=1 Tax=Niveispirillum sp. SYP-B3756 TaxID=2662178 RepID=UPI001290D36A|nr:chaperone NapD [Niveispirillum sp. SYP-B3756]MQP67841.1 sorbose reductase [Niveispirillum sp. SYP-B3756]
MSDEIHISSLIVHACPDALAAIAARIQALGGEIVPTDGDASRLIVLIEQPSARATADMLDAINAIAGVYSALPVYHHAEPALSLAEPMP